MIVTLRLFFTVVFLSMVALTSWAGLQVPLWSIPRAVGSHPWFIATLFDAYWGFFTFFAWVCYKETAWLSRLLWFFAIVLLGNMAMAAYGLAVTLRVPTHAPAADILLRGRPVPWAIAALLLAGFALVAAIAATT